MSSIGFGLERFAWLALDWPRLATAIFVAILALTGLGVIRLSFDEDLRNAFASASPTYVAYKSATSEFVDPENETLVLVEGDFSDPATFQRLQDFQFELQLSDGVDTVYSLFALRDPPDEDGNARLLVNDAGSGLTPALSARIRAHPILGAKLLSADGRAMVYVVTPSELKAPLSVARRLRADIEAIADALFGAGDVIVTVSGFPTVRAGIVDVLKRDQIVLNGTGSLIGLVMSLLVFRSLTAAILAAIPAIIGGFTVIGFMGLAGMPVTVMSNVVPALVMILGYANGMHLCFAFRRHRDAGKGVHEAERLAQREVGGACALAAITTAVAFTSLTISEVLMVRSFGLAGAAGIIGGTVVILVAHALMTLAIGRFWKQRHGATANFLTRLVEPCGAVGSFAVRHARPLSVAAIGLLVVFAIMHFSVPPQHSVREHLPRDNPANAALGRIDRELGGVFPIQILVPLSDMPATSPEALDKIARVHDAVARVEGVSTPLSLWSLARWLGDGDAAVGARAIDDLLAELTPTTRSRFLGQSNTATVTVTVAEARTEETKALIDAIERAAKAAGGDDIEATGFTVLNSREGARTISNLNLSLSLSVLFNLGVIALAFRSIPIGIISFLPNFLPILATGAFLFVTGRGMQFTSVIALTVAFGIAVDDSVHFLNRFILTGNGSTRVSDRLIETSRRIGPVLVGTTMIIIAGMSTTLTSGLPTISLFGWIAAMTLAIAIVGDLVILPALMAGIAKRWFDQRRPLTTEPKQVPA